MGDVGVRADEEIRQRTSFLPARPAVFFKGFPGLKGGVEQQRQTREGGEAMLKFL